MIKVQLLLSVNYYEKGVKESIIDEALKVFSFDEQLNKAQTICQKEMTKNKRDSEFLLKQKLEQKLLRKGYRSDIISEAISNLESKEEDEVLQALHYQGEKFKRKYANETGFQYFQKMKTALYRKGFSIDLIEDYLRETTDDE